jgi:hypothetical protein
VPEEVPAFESGLRDRVKAEHPGILNQINRSGGLTDEMREALTEVIADYHTAWLEGDAPRGAEGPVLSQAEGPVLSQAEGPVLSQAEGRNEQ